MKTFSATRQATLRNKKITEDFGTVQGSSSFASYLSSLCAAINTAAGAEIAPRLRHLKEARDRAFVQMREKAAAKGATGVVSMRFRYRKVSAISGVTEVICTARAVKAIDTTQVRKRA